MAQEIERKFLVKGNFKPEVFKSTRIMQGYLSSVPERTVRVRINGEQGFLTIKGKGNHSGIRRYEWEKEIPLNEAEELLQLCEPGIIDKVRNLVPVGKHTWEVDVFHGDNEGLILAEIELASEDEPFERPDWVGHEVSGDRRYYNSMLTKYPYKQW